MELVTFGPRGGENRIFKKDGTGFLKSFIDSNREALGLTAEEEISQYGEEIRQNRQSLREAEKQLKNAERINAQKEAAAQEVLDLRIRIERTQAKIDQLGSNVENESELCRLKQLKKKP